VILLTAEEENKWKLLYKSRNAFSHSAALTWPGLLELLRKSVEFSQNNENVRKVKNPGALPLPCHIELVQLLADTVEINEILATDEELHNLVKEKLQDRGRKRQASEAQPQSKRFEIWGWIVGLFGKSNV